MPPNKNECKFSYFSATCFVPLVKYFDFESFLLPVAGYDAATDQSSTGVIEKHKPCGFALAVVDHHSNVPYFNHMDNSGKLDVSPKNLSENLSHANQMWKLLGCKSLQDYHDAYLKLDCALLACEFHRELSFLI